MEKDSKLLIAGRDIAVSELCMEDKAEFGKVGIQWLVGLVPLIGEEGYPFLEVCMRVASMSRVA